MKVIELRMILKETDDEAEVELATNETEAMLLQGRPANNYIYHQGSTETGEIKKVLTLF